MIGAIAGDIIGSPYEFDYNNIKTTKFPLWNPNCSFTDDSIMSLAIASALMMSQDNKTDFEQEAVSSMRRFGLRYPYAGYGTRFSAWLVEDDPQPYDSWGNGSAMRVSAIGWAFDSLEETEEYAMRSARVTHNHPEGIKGAQATAAAVFLARTGSGKKDIRTYIEQRFNYDFSRTLDDIRPDYHHVESCQKTVPESMTAFFESDGYEDAIRKVISIGGDSDTTACICGSIAEAYYGMPKEIETEARNKLDPFLLEVLDRWNAWIKQRQNQSCAR